MRVGLLVTCLVDLMRPNIGFSAIRLLEAAGCEVVVPASQTCCGQPGYNSGDLEAGRAMARKMAREFEGCDYVVGPSGSCVGMVHEHYPRLFPDTDPDAAAVKGLAARTFELTDFLVRIAKLEKAPGRFEGRVTYHDSCSGLRELKVRDQPRKLLGTVAGLELVEMKDATTCCGFGGTFSIKLGDISTRMADNKVNNARTTGARAIVGGDLGCLLSIEGRLRRGGDRKTEVWHVAEVLAGLTQHNDAGKG